MYTQRFLALRALPCGGVGARQRWVDGNRLGRIAAGSAQRVVSGPFRGVGRSDGQPAQRARSNLHHRGCGLAKQVQRDYSASELPRCRLSEPRDNSNRTVRAGL